MLAQLQECHGLTKHKLIEDIRQGGIEHIMLDQISEQKKVIASLTLGTPNVSIYYANKWSIIWKTQPC